MYLLLGLQLSDSLFGVGVLGVNWILLVLLCFMFFILFPEPGRVLRR